MSFEEGSEYSAGNMYICMKAQRAVGGYRPSLWQGRHKLNPRTFEIDVHDSLNSKRPKVFWACDIITLSQKVNPEMQQF